MVSNGRTQRLSDLELLAHFLNFDFRSGNVRELTKVFQSSLAFAKFPTKLKGRQIQQKLRRDLLPVLDPPDDLGLVDAYGLLEKLVNKINQMGLTRKWAVEPVDYDFVDVSVDPRTGDATGKTFDLETIQGDEARQKLQDYLAPGQRPLEILGARWIISERASLIESSKLESYLYWTVIQALERGTLSNLKRCKQCKGWFNQKDARKEFCTQKCKYAFHNKRRLEGGYFTALRREKKKRALKRARGLLKEGKSLEAVSKRTGLSLRVLRRVID
ncbi:MAG: hypothetical protein HYY46_25885 [Deltaproteobacteria bacterium]|nr:hypothetical protein [Deltaproteobacteria bacterium]